MTGGTAGFLRELAAAAIERARALPTPPPRRAPRRSFADAVRGRRAISLIAEFKRRSPSRGELAAGADPVAHARRAESAGARALSVLTEPRWFGGSFADLDAARGAASLPLLAKDVVVHPAQIATADAHGADAVLLVLRCLDGARMAELLACATARDLDVILECHDEAEIERALDHECALVGVNNRDLDTLQVDLRTAARLLPRVPAHRLAIAESGYEDPADLRPLHGLCDAVLVGSSLMRGLDPGVLVRGGAR